MTDLYTNGDRVSVRLGLEHKWQSATVVGKTFSVLVVQLRDGRRIEIPRQQIPNLVRPTAAIVQVCA